MLKEFKEFAMKGNVVDMAIGIVIGAAFGTIIKSMVADVIMPPIGMLMGGVDFQNLFTVLQGVDGVDTFASLAAAKEAGAVTINYGVFINHVISFIIVAFAIFMLVKAMNSAKKKEVEAPAAAPTTKKCGQCLSEIPLDATRCAFCTSVVE